MTQQLTRVLVNAALVVAVAGCGAEVSPPKSSSGGGSAGSDALANGGGQPSSGAGVGEPSAGAAATTSGGGSTPATAGATASSGGAGLAGAASSGAGGAGKSAGCGVAEHPLSGVATIDVSGTSRDYILKVPDGYDANKPYKLVFGWHWRGGEASSVANGQLGGGPYYGLEKLAQGTAIFVAPNGIDNGWANTGGRDIAFLKAMLASFESTLCIDASRVFSTGFSYGGMMSDTIGCDMADVFRAVAPMSGALYSGCTRSNTQPVAVWLSHGNMDDVVPLADGKAALDVFLKKNGCGSETTPAMPSPCVAYQGCAAGYPVNYCEFDGGHMPPSFASSAIWQFFSQF